MSKRGKLHVYVVAPEQVRQYVDDYHAMMRRHTGLISVQPREFLHVTVQLLEAHADDVSAADIAALGAALRAELENLPTFELTLGPPVIGVHSLGLRSSGIVPAFTELVRHTRAAAEKILGPQALHDGGALQRPHASLGYGLADGDSDPLIGELNALNFDRDPVRFTVDQVELLAVDQDATAGVYTWSKLNEIELAPSRARVR
ncbi:2'-5' RNA ligase family protein [Kribbella sp. NPDC056345]|uniref:2'-5' RNA ligase family protein n=1 Tax=Kribbella sp. NPDC056345 TaxID=3345789 RepID=UPI0035DD7FC2